MNRSQFPTPLRFLSRTQGAFQRCRERLSHALNIRMSVSESVQGALDGMDYFRLKVIPRDYYLLGTQIAPHTGFGFQNPSQIIVSYGSPHYAGERYRRLEVVTASENRRPFFKTDGRVPLLVKISAMDPDQEIAAEYFDALWRYRRDQPDSKYWDLNDHHALVFNKQGLAVAIRGSRLAGIGFNELRQLADTLELTRS